MKQLIRKGLILCAISLLVFNFSIDVKNVKNGNTTISLLKNMAFATGEEPALCLHNYIYEHGKAEQNDKKCWRDEQGPDIFEGYVVTCPAGGQGCQPTYCSSGDGCFTTVL